MTEQEFRKNLLGADPLRTLSTGLAPLFWEGYEKGLRRLYYGEKFGPVEEHEAMMKAIEEKDDSRVMMGRGYRAGFEGVPFLEARDMVFGLTR
jgi:hypothetical protein